MKEFAFHLFLQIREVAKEEGIFAKDEFKTMLQFYHDLGVIVYYGGLGTLDNTLRNTVILKPQWLVDMFKRIITVRDLEQQVKFHFGMLVNLPVPTIRQHEDILSNCTVDGYNFYFVTITV